MNRIRSLAAALCAAAALVAAPLHGQAAARCAPAAPMPVTHMAIEHRQELGISAAQLRRLRVIDARLKPAPAHAGHGQAQGHAGHGSGHAGHGQAQGSGHAGHGQAAAAHPVYGATAAEITRGNTQARAVLTARQRTRLDALHARHHGAAAECAPAPAAARSHG
ncbi:MAG TPA: hypothetical protein VE913_23740 [Longimicrobium sp.]|nr:hypothetical protein [Longimicrobium sp.]